MGKYPRAGDGHRDLCLRCTAMNFGNSGFAQRRRCKSSHSGRSRNIQLSRIRKEYAKGYTKRRSLQLQYLLVAHAAVIDVRGRSALAGHRLGQAPAGDVAPRSRRVTRAARARSDASTEEVHSAHHAPRHLRQHRASAPRDQRHDLLPGSAVEMPAAQDFAHLPASSRSAESVACSSWKMSSPMRRRAPSADAFGQRRAERAVDGLARAAAPRLHWSRIQMRGRPRRETRLGVGCAVDGGRLGFCAAAPARRRAACASDFAGRIRRLRGSCRAAAPAPPALADRATPACARFPPAFRETRRVAFVEPRSQPVRAPGSPLK